MRIAIARETQPGETRVALLPDGVKTLVAAKAEIAVERGAAAHLGASDADYSAVGASIVSDRGELLASADIWPVVARPSDEDTARLKRGAIIVGFLRPLDEPAALQPAITRGTTLLSM